MPALVTSAPSPDAPWASSASIQSPHSRVSRPIRSWTRRSAACPAEASAKADPAEASAKADPAEALAKAERTSAAPRRRTVGGSSGYSPAWPRTPSVPNSRVRLFATADPHLDGRRFNARDTGVGRRVGVHGE